MDELEVWVVLGAFVSGLLMAICEYKGTTLEYSRHCNVCFQGLSDITSM